MSDPNHAVVFTHRDVYNQVQGLDDKIDKLTLAVSEVVNLHKRLDSQHERQNSHSERIRVLEAKLLAHAVIIGIMTAAITAAVIAVFVNYTS